MQTTDLNKEFDRLYAISVGETWIPNEADMLAAALKNISPDYFQRTDRMQASELLSEKDRGSAMLLYQLIASSKLSEICKQRICGTAIFFLKNTCRMTAKEISEFKKTSPGFDPDDFDLFEGLGPNGE